MPKIKSVNGVYDGTNYHFEESGVFFYISPTSDYVWFGDSAYEFTSLAPQLTLENKGLRTFGGSRTDFPVTRGSLSSKSSAFCPTTDAESDRWAYGDNLCQWTDQSFLSSLDKEGRINSGSLWHVNDNAGNDVMVVPFNIGTTNNGLAIFQDNTQSVLHQSSSIASQMTYAEWYAESPSRGWNGYTVGNQYTSGSIDYRKYAVLHIDTSTKTIYLKASGYRKYYANRDILNFGSPTQRTLHNTRVTSIMTSTYTTHGDDGSVSFTTPTQLQMTYGGLLHYGQSTPLFYMGLNDSGNPCFLIFVENSSFKTVDLNGFSHTTLYMPSNATKPNGGRIYMYEHNPSNGALTLHADLRADEGFVGDVGQATTLANQYLSDYTPTHFEPSPIAGEDDLYYAYSPIFDSATKTLRFLLLTWDKVLNTLSAEVVTPTMNVGEAISDYITHASHGNTNSHQDLCLNCVLTKLGATYALSVFYSHTTRTSLTNMVAPTTKNLVSFNIDPADFSSLSFNSSISFPVLSWTSQNQDNTRLLVIKNDSGEIYDWNNGWSQSASESGYFTSLTHDTQGRYWGTNISDLDISGKANYGYLQGSFKRYEVGYHVLSASLPSLVSCAWEDEGNFTYTGVALSKNVVVNAYDENGARVAKSVTLQITGSATFVANGLSSLTTQTSAVADTLVAVSISSAGQVSISASFSL